MPALCAQRQRCYVRTETCRSVLTGRIAAGGHDSVNTRQLEIVKAVPGRIVTEYKIGPQNRA